VLRWGSLSLTPTYGLRAEKYFYDWNFADDDTVLAR